MYGSSRSAIFLLVAFAAFICHSCATSPQIPTIEGVVVHVADGVDSIAPYTDTHSPAKDATGIPVTSRTLSWYVRDSLKVVRSSIAVTLNGSAITPTITPTSTSAGSYLVSFTHPTDWDGNTTYTVGFTARDMIGNLLSESWTFRTKYLVWYLTWQQEFDVTDGYDPGCTAAAPCALDNTYWFYEMSATAPQDTNHHYRVFRNNELQYYVDDLETVSVQDNILLLKAQRRTYDGASRVTSGSITTAAEFGLKKGFPISSRIDVRAKFTDGVGAWPAIWQLGVPYDWPASGEIDIVEWWPGRRDPVSVTVHTAEDGHSYSGVQVTLRPDPTNYHVYSVERHCDRVVFLIDDVVRYTYRNDGLGNKETWPFGREYFDLRLTLAWGGGGDNAVYPVEESDLPQMAFFDYVRLYELGEPPDPTVQ